MPLATSSEGLAPSEFTSIYDRALRLLGFRARSVVELRRKLSGPDVDAMAVEAVISRLLDQRLLDDADFARQFARGRLLGAGASHRRIAMELARKGVSRDVADAALDALAEQEGLNPGDAIARVAEKKWRALARLNDFTRRRRLYAFLARRGFTPDEIRSAMSALGAETDG